MRRVRFVSSVAAIPSRDISETGRAVCVADWIFFNDNGSRGTGVPCITIRQHKWRSLNLADLCTVTLLEALRRGSPRDERCGNF